MGIPHGKFTMYKWRLCKWKLCGIREGMVESREVTQTLNTVPFGGDPSEKSGCCLCRVFHGVSSVQLRSSVYALTNGI